MARPSSRRRNRTRSPADTPTPADEDRQDVGSFRRLPGRPTEADAEFWSQPPDFPGNYGKDDEEARRNNSLRTRARRTAPEQAPPQRVRGRQGRERRETKRQGRPRSISSNGQEPTTGLGALVPARRGLPLSDATISRVSAAVLWVLVIVAAYGGITTWLGSGSSSSGDATVPLPGDVPDGRWAAAGFAERYVTAYLLAGSDGSMLAPYLGYSPELPATAAPAASTGPIRTVEVSRADDNRRDYWSVIVAVGDPSRTEDESARDGTEAEAATGTPSGETFWQVGIDTSGDQPVAAGLPAPVAGPPEPDRAEAAVSLSQPSTNDAAVESVQGFLAAYLCGAADLDRYLHPEAALRAVSPPVCQQVEVSRWGSAPVPGTGDEGVEPRQTVVAEVVLDSGSRARRATYGLTLAQRDGRWEVAELLPAPPITER